MRNGQNKRMRGRNRKTHNPLTRVYESNGPDVKIRGTPSHIAEKYLQLARDAQSSSDPVAAENYFQHAEHYFRLIAVAQEQFRQTPQLYRPDGGSSGDPRDDFDDGEEDTTPGNQSGDQPSFGTRDPQPYLPRDAQFFPPREPPYGRPQQEGRPQQDGARPQQDVRPQQDGRPQHEGRQQGGAPGRDDEGAVDRLPSFITGGGQPPQAQAGQQNGFEPQGDRFPLHRRRRRHRGPRGDGPGDSQGMSEGGDDTPPAPRPAGD